MTNLTFNILTFEHPQTEYTFYFTDKEQADLCRVFHTLVPDEVNHKFAPNSYFEDVIDFYNFDRHHLD